MYSTDNLDVLLRPLFLSRTVTNVSGGAKVSPDTLCQWLFFQRDKFDLVGKALEVSEIERQ